MQSPDELLDTLDLMLDLIPQLISSTSETQSLQLVTINKLHASILSDAVGGCRNDKMLIAVIIVLAIFLAVMSVAAIALFCRVLKTKTKKKNDTIYSVAQKNEFDTIL